MIAIFAFMCVNALVIYWWFSVEGQRTVKDWEPVAKFMCILGVLFASMFIGFFLQGFFHVALEPW